jgi:hypothetical protein
MFTRSHLQEMKRRYASIYAPPVEEKVIEDGTDEGANQYKKDTPGQDIEKEFKEHCGVCGEQGIEEDEIEEGTALQVKMALSDAGLKGTWKNNKVYVKKKDVKKAEKALKGNVIYRGKPPVVVGEEVEIDEAKKPTRDAGMECMECGKKFRAKLSTLQYGRTKCPKCKSTDLDFAFGESVKEEVELVEKFAGLNEALTPKDKEVINTFYSKETLGGKLLSTDGKSLEKHGLGGQTIAVWKNNKIVVTAVSDVKSTDTILNYMKKSIPKLNFDKKSWQEFFEEVEVAEGWKKGKYTIKDENGKILGTYSSGGKAKKVMDDLMQKGDYPELTVSMVEEVEVDEGIRDFKLGDKVKFANDDSDFWGQTGKITSLSGNGISQKATVKLNKGGKSVTNVLVKVDLIKEEVEIDDLFTKMIEPADAYTESIKKYSEHLVDKTKNLIDEAKGTAYPATVDTLRKIVKDKQHQTVMFKSGKAIVDLFTASAMVQVYDALKKPEMKKTFEKMIKDKAGFMKTQAFAMKMIGK